MYSELCLYHCHEMLHEEQQLMSSLVAEQDTFQYKHFSAQSPPWKGRIGI
jgi:hypothetical protein